MNSPDVLTPLNKTKDLIMSLCHGLGLGPSVELWEDDESVPDAVGVNTVS